MLRLRSFLFVFWLTVSASAQTPNEPALKSHDALVYPPIARAARVSGQVTVEFSINDKGDAVDIIATDGPAMLKGSAANFVSSWKFDLSDAAAAGAKYHATIQYKAVQGIIDPRDYLNPVVHSDSFHHFEITTLISDVELSKCPTGADEDVPSHIGKDDFVEISRSGCMGSCPTYSVRVNADGTVVWNGQGFVEAIGRRESRIDARVARDLLDEFRTKTFWSYCGSYWTNITDSGGTEITVKLGSRTRTVSDYAESGPDELHDLLLNVDRTANSHRWRHGDPAKEPITRIDGDTYLPKPGVTPLMMAAGNNESEKLKALIAAGNKVGEVDASGWTALMYAARGTSGSSVQALLKAGADPNQSSPHGDTPLMFSALSGFWDDDLVKAGAKINTQNKDGETALMILAARDEADEIRGALQVGADATLKDAKGRTALDYLKLASCGRSPLYDPLTTNLGYGSAKCTDFDTEDLHKTERLLKVAVRENKHAVNH
jgi:hypothetical protein